MCIYAILGVDMFSRYGREGSYETVAGATIPLMTARGMTYGEEYYGNFCRSLFTLFQVMTGESWSEIVARPVIFGKGIEYRSIFFYTTYVLVCSIILVNVAIAVLLEKMVDNDPSTDGIDVIASLKESDIASLKQGVAPEEKSPSERESADAASPKVEAAILELKQTMEAEVKTLRDEAAQREKRLLEAIDALSTKLVWATDAVQSATFKRRHHRSKHRDQSYDGNGSPAGCAGLGGISVAVTETPQPHEGAAHHHHHHHHHDHESRSASKSGRSVSKPGRSFSKQPSQQSDQVITPIPIDPASSLASQMKFSA